MVDAESFDDSSLRAELRETRPRRVEAADHHDVVGDGDEQGTGQRVGVALAQQRIDLERGPARV